MFDEFEEKRRVSDICSGEPLEDAVCETCANTVAAALKSEHDQALQEYELYTRQYEDLLRQLQNAEAETIQDKQAALRQAEVEEAALLAKSKALEEEATAVRAKVCELEHKGAVLQQMHASYWRDYNDLQLQLRSTDRDSLRRKIEATQAQVEALNKTNVINDAFHIAHNDMFATINGFRLGSVQSQPVDWDEINAAWGQTALLVQTLASHWDFTFPRSERRRRDTLTLRSILSLPWPALPRACALVQAGAVGSLSARLFSGLGRICAAGVRTVI